MITSFSTLSQTISTRRTTKPNQFNGRSIPDEQISQLLELADWAPTHAYTEPWRFKIYTHEKVSAFCSDHAKLYQQLTPPENFLQAKYDKLLHMGDFASHII